MVTDIGKSYESSELSLMSLIAIIHKLNNVHTRQTISKYGLTLSQLHLLLKLLKNNNLTQDELANSCQIDKSAVAKVLKKMEDQNLILREIVPENRRKYSVSLTPKGIKLANELKQLGVDREKQLCKNMSFQQKEELFTLLSTIVEQSILSK